jgi:hypothetical protein
MAYSCLFLKPSIAYSKEAHQLQPKLPAVKSTRLMLPAPALSYSFQDDRSQSRQFRVVQNYGSLKKPFTTLSRTFRELFARDRNRDRDVFLCACFVLGIFHRNCNGDIACKNCRRSTTLFYHRLSDTRTTSDVFF